MDSPLADACAKKHIAEQTDKSVMDSRPESIQILGKDYTINWDEEMENFLDDIDQIILEGKDSSGLSPMERMFISKVREFSLEYVPKDMVEDLPISSASSGARLKGQRPGQVLPGFLASAYELRETEDFSEFDAIVGYTPSERITNTKLRSVKNKATFIPHRSKVDVRCIFLLFNEGQDRLSFFAHLLTQLNKKLRWYCKVYHQDEAPKTMVDWFIRKYRAIYSLDLHAATDRLARSTQVLELRHILRWTGRYSEDEINILCNCWDHYMSLPVEAYLPGSHSKVKWSLITGQQMGFQSSVHFLNTDHILGMMVCLRVMDRILKEHNKPASQAQFVIIGDDNGTGLRNDKDMIFPIIYRDFMAAQNTECNLAKGYLFNKDQPNYQRPLAEIAKNLICNGVNITPFPPGATRLCGNVMGCTSFMVWLINRNKEVFAPSLTDLWSYFSSAFSEEEALMVIFMALSPLKNQVNQLFDQQLYVRERDIPVITVFSLILLRHLLILDRLGEFTRYPDQIPDYLTRHSFEKEFRQLFDGIIANRESLSHNKVVKFVEKLELEALAQNVALESFAKGVLPEDQSVYDYLPTLRKFDEQSLSALFLIGDFFSNLEVDDIRECFKSFSVLEWKFLYENISKVSFGDFSGVRRYSSSETSRLNSLNPTEVMTDFRLAYFRVIDDDWEQYNQFVEYWTGSIPRALEQHLWESNIQDHSYLMECSKEEEEDNFLEQLMFKIEGFEQ